MRFYIPAAVSNLITLVVLIASLGVALLIGAKAFKMFSSDAALDEIPQVIQKANPK